ncbi:MAG: HAD family hydrolase [Thermoleophilia bacterium]|nr:HAD family hydrolase [Thermoleophilia bacterium]
MTSPPEAGATRPAAVVFDCDGVLIESVEIKTEAFVELFADHPEHHEAIARHHQDNLGVSRFEKFAWIYRELLGRELDADESAELGRRFSQLVFERAVRCPEVLGTSETLATLHAAGIPLFVASGTPQEELERLIAARGWRESFRGIHGSPSTKPWILSAISRALGCAPGSLVFVGDGRSDLDAAREAGVPFILRATAAQEERFAGYDGPRIADLGGLAERLTRPDQSGL